MFPDLEWAGPTPAPRGSWYCAACGADDGLTILGGRPALDAKFALGWCDTCAPPMTRPPKGQPARRTWKDGRPVAQFVSAGAWDQDAFNARARARTEAEILTRYWTGRRLTKADQEWLKAHPDRLTNPNQVGA